MEKILDLCESGLKANIDLAVMLAKTHGFLPVLENMYGYQYAINQSLEDVIFSGLNLCYKGLDGVVKIEAKKVKKIDISSNSLKVLDVSGCKELRVLNCRNNVLKNLDLKNCLKIEKIICGINNLKNLDLKHCKNLFLLSCPHNELKNLNLEGLGKLEYLNANFNLLKNLNIKGCVSIDYLTYVNNKPLFTKLKKD